MNYGVINKEVLEFIFSNKTSALELKPEIVDLASDNIPDIVDEVSKKYFGEDEFLRINNLEIDLGIIDKRDFRNEIIEKFYTCFEGEIKKIRSNHIRYNEVDILQNVVLLNFELLKYFLDNGVLPWWAVAKEKINIDKIIKRVTTDSPDIFYNYLKSISSNDIIMKRIISQFTNKEIEEIIFFIKKKNSSADSFIKIIEHIFATGKKDVIQKEVLNKSIIEILLRHVIGAKANIDLKLLSIELITLIARKTELKKTFVLEILGELLAEKNITIAPGFQNIPDIEKYLNEIIYNYKTKWGNDVAFLLPRIKELLLTKSINGPRIEDYETVGVELNISDKKKNNLLSDEKQEIIFGKNGEVKNRIVLEDGIKDENIVVNKKKTSYGKKTEEYLSEKRKYSLEEIIDEKQNIIFPDVGKEDKHNKTEEIKKNLQEIINIKNGEEKNKDIHREENISFEEKEVIVEKLEEKDFEPTSERDMTLKEKSNVRKGKRISILNAKEEKELKYVSDKSIISEESEDEKLCIEETIHEEKESMITSERDTADIENKIVMTIQKETEQILKPFSKEEKNILKERETLNIPEKIYIDNSGLVLASAFIPTLFERLKMFDENKTMKMGSALRGVHILQYLATDNAEAFEYELALNKILCGIDLLYPIDYKYEISNVEKKEVNDLLESMIKNWKALGSISVAGLRESFLLRKGIITNEDEKFILQVEQKAFDILLDRIPWSYSIIKYSWMNKPVYVEWR